MAGRARRAGDRAAHRPARRPGPEQPDLPDRRRHAVWKIAIIGEGVLGRARDEPRNAAEGGPPSTAYIDHMVDQAWGLATHYGF